MRASAAAHLGLRAVGAVREAAGHAWTRVRDRGLAPSGSVWTRLRGHALAATPVDVFDADAAIAATLADLSAIAPDGAAPSGLYAQQGDAIAPLARFRARPGAVRVFRAWATRGGRYLAGPDVGVDVVGGVAQPPEAHTRDIDAVFTWVDGSDPAWQERKRRRLEGPGGAPRHETAANDARFAQIDELRYALRAVARYAPWLRRVYLVTDGQRPPWLAEEFPEVTLVRHDEIFSDPAALPTFNSHAIESRLHHIPGLAERYLYLNDDFFLGRYARPADYFTADGKPRVFLTEEAIPDTALAADDHPVVAAAKNNTAILQRLTGTRASHKLKHAPYAMLRSVALELEALAAEQFAATARSPFRSPTDVSAASSLLPYYALATGRAVAGEMSHFYADVASPELRWRLPRLLEHRDADVICLNATTAPTRRASAIHAFLEAYFPPLKA